MPKEEKYNIEITYTKCNTCTKINTTYKLFPSYVLFLLNLKQCLYSFSDIIMPCNIMDMFNE